MEESLGGKLFINSEQVGDYIDIVMPAKEKQPEEPLQIHYLEAGIGEPLLLIHGIGQSLYTWRNLFADLSENYRVIAIDLPGHGYSSRPEYFCYSMDEMADVLKLFMDEKGIVSAHIIGFSTGSLYMMRLLSKYPEYVANCIAISPGGITKQMPGFIKNMKRPLKAVFARNLFSFNDVEKCLQECLYNQTTLTERVVKQYYYPISDGLSREALMYAIQNFDFRYVIDTLKESDHEILLLWGKEDRWHTPNSSVMFQGILKNGRYFLVRNSGHIVQEDTPEKLYRVILSYIPSAVNYYQPEEAAGYYVSSQQNEGTDCIRNDQEPDIEETLQTTEETEETSVVITETDVPAEAQDEKEQEHD